MSLRNTKFGDLEKALEQAISLKVSLAGARPQIWRRILVPVVFPLGSLHDVIQISMGWENCHLHCFTIGEKQYSAHYDDDEEPIGENADSVLLFEIGVTKSGFRFEYEYDFGDSWTHEILAEKIHRLDPNKHYPYCEKAVRACPPEDCGGVYGYSQLLRILKNPKHREYDDMVEWIGIESFDPKAIDLGGINERLKERFAT